MDKKNQETENENDSLHSKHDKKFKKKYEELLQKYLEVLAESENLRKRTNKEISDILKYRSMKFTQNILPTIDMFELAFLSEDNLSSEMKNYLVGFKMIFDGFKRTLEEEGVKEIKVKIGDSFDPNQHFVIEEQVTNEYPSGKIIEVKAKGYLLYDRLIRPVSVITSKKEEKKVEEKKVEEEKVKGK